MGCSKLPELGIRVQSPSRSSITGEMSIILLPHFFLLLQGSEDNEEAGAPTNISHMVVNGLALDHLAIICDCIHHWVCNCSICLLRLSKCSHAK